MFRDLSQVFYSKFKTFFYFKLFIRACWRLDNDFKLTRFAFDVRQKFVAVPRE